MTEELLDLLKNFPEAMENQSKINYEVVERLERLEKRQLEILKRELERAKILSGSGDLDDDE